MSLQTVEPGGQDMETIAKAAIAAKPNFVLWTGGAAAGGELVKALRDAGYKGTFTATAASEAPAFLAAAGKAGEGAFVMATSTPQNTPTAEQWGASFEQRTSASRASTPSRATTPCGRSRTRSRRPRAPTAARWSSEMTTLDPKFVNSLGRVRFAGDHTLLYDNRVILKVKDGSLHLGAVVAHGFAGVSARPALLAALALAVGAPAARSPTATRPATC